MRRLLRALGIIVLAIIGFMVVSYVMFGDDPASRLKLELDHDIRVAESKLRTISDITGCTLTLDVNKLDASGIVIEGQKLTIPIKALANSTSTAGPGYINFLMSDGQTATCTNLDGSACSKPDRTEVQLNMPGIKTDDQAVRVIGWVKELSETCIP